MGKKFQEIIWECGTLLANGGSCAQVPPQHPHGAAGGNNNGNGAGGGGGAAGMNHASSNGNNLQQYSAVVHQIQHQVHLKQLLARCWAL